MPHCLGHLEEMCPIIGVISPIVGHIGRDCAPSLVSLVPIVGVIGKKCTPLLVSDGGKCATLLVSVSEMLPQGPDKSKQGLHLALMLQFGDHCPIASNWIASVRKLAEA